MISDIALTHRDLAGVHFTGSTGVFNSMWETVGKNMGKYRSYPRIVGETGGKDFIVAHPSADPQALAVGMVRGAFEYQGQKCSAASRAYIPTSLWPTVKERCIAMMAEMKQGDTRDFSNFVAAVIDERAFNRLAAAIDEAKAKATIVAGGGYDKSKGWFIEPTIVETKDPNYRSLCEELFGPLLTVYVYDDAQWLETLKIVDGTSPYALTGAVFSRDRQGVREAMSHLRNAAGNFYVNDKPTGAVVGQQPFGGARGSGTNDKAGSYLNLLRWVSPRTIKETFVSPVDYRYPFLG
jgi:1-pyrroline-5-carboxylate dehydrogenase